MTQREQRVTPLELFFDLVFVYAITQVTLLMSNDPTWQGIGRGLLILGALWWSWTGYAWLTNTLEPEEGFVRLGMFAAMAAMLVVALAVPGSFDESAALFGVAYLAVRLLHLALYALAGKRDPDLLEAVVRFTPSATIAPVLILFAAFFDGAAQAALWVVALAVDYLGALRGGGQGWSVGPAHFAERHGLIVIIALGESIRGGRRRSRRRLADARRRDGRGVAIVVIAALWWTYFDVYAVLAQQQLSQTSGATRARIARDLYSYLHLPMIAGIVLFAMGLKKTIEQVGEPLDTVPAVALCGGLAHYFSTHNAFRVRIVHFVRRTSTDRPGWVGPGRLAAAIAMLAILPAALAVSALTALALVSAVCCALVAWDVLRYREHRVEVRQARP